MNAVVIGAGRGLGLCLTQALLEKGAHVAAGVRGSSARLDLLQEEYGERLTVFSCDVTDEAGMLAGAALCREALGDIHSVCNCAGVLPENDRKSPLHECDISELRETLDVNVVGAVAAIKCFYPQLSAGGRFFTITSEGVGIESCGSWVPCYALSKTSATKISGIMNASVGDVDFYSVHPGRMNTDMGRTTAQIEPEEAAAGISAMMTGETQLSRGCWYVDYRGNKMEC